MSEGIDTGSRRARSSVRPGWLPQWAIGVAGVLVMLTCLAASMGLDRLGVVPTGPNRSLRVLLEGLQAMIGALVALLVYGRLRLSRHSDDLLLSASLGVTASMNLLVAVGLSLTSAASHDGLDSALDWGSLAGRGVAAACFVVAALGPQRRVAVPSPTVALASVVAFPVVIVVAAAAVARSAGWPLAVVAHTDGAGITVLEANPAFRASQAVLMAVWVASAIGFTLRARRTDDPFLARLGLAAAVGAVARLQFLIVPSLYSDVIRVGDLSRFADHVILLAAAVAEIRSYWAAEAVVQAQRERQRLARSVHDGLVQELCFLRAHAASVAAGRSHAALASHVNEAIERAYDESRRLLDVLDGPPLSLLAAEWELADPLLGLRIEVEALAARAGVEADVHWSADRPGDGREVLALHGIAREAVSNALRHARPERVTVEVWPEPACALRVVDDGIGIDLEAGTGFGRRAMIDLALELDADLWVGPAPAGGTMVEVRRR